MRCYEATVLGGARVEVCSLTQQRAVGAAAVFGCVFSIVLVGCGGGGPSALDEVPSAGRPAPSTSPSVTPLDQSAYRPTLYIEQDPNDGSKFLRVEEPL